MDGQGLDAEFAEYLQGIAKSRICGVWFWPCVNDLYVHIAINLYGRFVGDENYSAMVSQTAYCVTPTPDLPRERFVVCLTKRPSVCKLHHPSW